MNTMHKLNKYTFVLFWLIFISNIQANTINDYLFPSPKETKIENGFLNFINGQQYANDKVIELCKSINTFNVTGNIKNYNSIWSINNISFKIDSGLHKKDEYILSIDSLNITITGKDEAALYYGKQTLAQVITYAEHSENKIPCLSIHDWADFERRGFMLDISRDKVPTMETLFHIIDMLSSWKINEIQLYTEHTFAYKNHKSVWENASPMTPEQIQVLDFYCKEHFIDLVPNQNSFGHMENWLKHDEYLDLAECPTDCKTIWGTRSKHSLNPINPGSLKLMQELYKELLPNFSSKYFNIGCDETVELGCGLTKEYCKEKGKGNVYLEYVKKLNNEVEKLNRTTMFWGDIVLNHPEVIKDIPHNMIALVWGYESNYPFDKNLAKFKNANLQFYVCPGTSSWNSIIGRNHDAFINLQQAAIYGKKYGAKGYLNTNWGDYGHWQPLSVCYPGMAVGAAYAWNADSKPVNNLNTILDTYVFKDSTGYLSKGLLMLGDAYLKCKIPSGNANAFHLMLQRYKWTMKGNYQTKLLKKDNLEEAEKTILEAQKILTKASPKSYDAEIIEKELNQAIDLALHGIHLGIARLAAKNQATKNIKQATKQELIDELVPIIQTHKEIWTLRNRPGGLDDSVKRMEDLLEYYKEE